MLDKFIQSVLGTLKWDVVHSRAVNTRHFMITSNPWRKRHTIHFPVSTEKWRDIEYLHELAHACLAERHHLLATAFFTKDTKPADCEAFVHPTRVAADWYADELLMQWVPDFEGYEIAEHANYAYRMSDKTAEIIYGGGLMLAQAVHYLKGEMHLMPRRYRPIIDVLLEFDPARPSVKAQCSLINALAAYTSSKRIELAIDGGLDVWKVVKK